MKKPELLAPVGGMEQLVYAIHYGADAIYMAGDQYGLRARATNFGGGLLAQAITYAHQEGVKAFIACNAIMHPEDLKGLPAYLEEINELGADALIVNDLASLQLAKKHAPRCEIHISTQCSITNAIAAQTYYDLGAKRVVLARELSLEEIAQIRQDMPKELELEVFCHGSMCMAYSGRCIISNKLAQRDANRGNCAQSCRWKYALMEETRPGKYIPIEEDARGSYIMSSEDMMMLNHIDDLTCIGVDCLKVEGRIKSAYYVGTVINAYRSVLDGADPQKFLPELDTVSHRPYSTGFYYGPARQAHEMGGYVTQCDWVASVLSCIPATHEAFNELPLSLDDVHTVLGTSDITQLYITTVTQKNKFLQSTRENPAPTLEVLRKSQVGKPLAVAGLCKIGTLDKHEDDTPYKLYQGRAPHTLAEKRSFEKCTPLIIEPVESAGVAHEQYVFISTQQLDELDIIRMRRTE